MQRRTAPEGQLNPPLLFDLCVGPVDFWGGLWRALPWVVGVHVLPVRTLFGAGFWWGFWAFGVVCPWGAHVGDGLLCVV